MGGEMFLIGASSWDFKDESTGRTVVGAKCLFATPTDADGRYGYTVTEVPIDPASKRRVCEAAVDLSMSHVMVTFGIAPRGKTLANVVTDIKAV